MNLFKNNKQDKETENKPQEQTTPVRKSMAERGSQSNSVSSENKAKTSHNVSDEQLGIDDINSVLIDDKAVQKIKQKEIKVQEKKETVQKVKKMSPVIYAVAGVLVAGVIALIVFKIIDSGNKVELKPVNTSVYTSEIVSPVSSTPSSDSETSTTEPKAELNLKTGVSSIGSPIEIGTYEVKENTVNVKTENGYKDIKSKFYYGLDNVAFGHSNISNFVDEYNKTSGKKKINIGTEENLQAGKTLAMFTVCVKYPPDYPSNNNDGKVFNVPDVSIRLLGNPKVNDNASSTGEDTSNVVEATSSTETSGTDETKSESVEDTSKTKENESQGHEDKSEPDKNEDTSNESEIETKENETVEESDKKYYTDYLTVNGENVKVSNLIPIVVKPSSVTIADGYTYRCITTLPKELKSTDYIIEITVGDYKAFYTGKNAE